MKKTTKLIIFAFSLTLIISAFAALGVSAAAEDEGALTIKSINIAYKDQIELLVAVDVDYAEKDNVEVTYTVDGEQYTAKLHPTETCVKDEVTYPVFYAAGIAPKDINKVMTFEAHIKDSDATGTPYSASILDYLYARLYKQNYINATTSDDIKRKDLYLNTIAYASSALDVLVNLNLEEAKREPLFITDYVFAWSDDDNAAVSAGRPFGAFPKGTEITPVYNGTVTDWSFTDVDGEKLGEAKDGVAYVLNEHTKLVAVVVDSYTVMDYENGASNAFVSSKDGDGNAITGNLPANANTLTMGLATDGDNQFLQVRNYADSKKTGVTTVNLSNTLQAGNCYTFETKVNVKGASAGYNSAQIKFVNNNGGEAVNLFLGMATVDGKTGVAIATTGDNSSIAKGTKLFDATDKVISTNTGWFTLRIEFYFGGPDAEDATDEEKAASKAKTYMKLYVDDILAYDGQANWAMGAGITHAQIDHISAGKTHNTCYDDIFFTRTDKAYVAGNEYAE
ncbi:MAG: hypothetical protein J6D20_06570 [Clostridia bacterium]|nr:hypothetical protein [Clostridia bacterium]